MAYANSENIIKRYGEEEVIELTDMSATGEVDEDVLNEALTDAHDLINSYVGKRHKLPLTTVPSLLVRLNCELARYYLYQKSSVPDEIQKSYDACLKTLSDISKGVIWLGEELDDKPKPADDVVFISGNDEMFSKKSMVGF